MINTFIGFGDSWAYGDGLDFSCEHTYLALLANQHNADYINYAQSGSSLPQLVIQFKKFLEEDRRASTRYCAIFFLTAKERFFTYHHQVDHEFNPRGIFPEEGMARELQKMNEVYYKYLYSDEFADYNANVTLITLQSLCRHYNIEDYYISGWQDYSNMWPEIDQRKIYKRTCHDFLNLEMDEYGCPLNNNPYFPSNDSHPNQLGHQKIADMLDRWIVLSK